MQFRLAHILLAVANIPADGSWSEAAIDGDGSDWAPRSRDIIAFINEHCGENLASSSYDDIRRKNLDFLVAASLVFNSAAKPGAATNDGTRGYAISPDASALFHKFGTSSWPAAAAVFKKRHGSLDSEFRRERRMPRTSVILPGGKALQLKDSPHNRLQKAVVQEFLPRFARDAQVLYLGDSNAKALHRDAGQLERLRFFPLENDRLPDVVAYEKNRNWLFLIEAVHSANPMSDLRHRILEKAASDCTAGLVFVSAFSDRASFAKWAGDVSWETEAWVADHPDHMIHFNGDRFMGPHPSNGGSLSEKH